MNITKRGEVWHLRRRVPKAYAPVDPRREVVISLRTEAETVAREKAPVLWAEQVEVWEAMLDGDTDDAEARFAAASGLLRREATDFSMLARWRVCLCKSCSRVSIWLPVTRCAIPLGRTPFLVERSCR